MTVLRYLSSVERLPVMVTPRWVQVTAQPIAIGDVLAYLRAALKVETERMGKLINDIGLRVD